MKPVQYSSFDRVADSFDRTRFIPLHVISSAYRIVFRRLRLKGSLTVVDAGVGTGRVIRPLFSKRLTLVGVDISLPMLRRLKQRYGTGRRRMELHLILADAAKLPLSKFSVDIVQCTHLLHLLKNWKATISEWQRVLGPRGSLVVFQEGGRDSSVGRVYELELRRTAHTRLRRRMVYSPLRRHLRKSGWRVYERKVEWRQRRGLLASLIAFEDRAYSWLWNIPEDIHSRVLIPVREWVWRQRAKNGGWEVRRRALHVMVASASQRS